MNVRSSLKGRVDLEIIWKNLWSNSSYFNVKFDQISITKLLSHTE